MSGGAREGRREQPAALDEELPCLTTLAELVDAVRRHPDVYVRWSVGPAADRSGASCDALTGVPLPGLSANPLAMEQWWEGRSLELWVARRLYDYRHLRETRGPDVRPWLLRGEEVGRGPDNEPLVVCLEPLCWLHEEVVDAATRMVDEQPRDWGTLRRN